MSQAGSGWPKKMLEKGMDIALIAEITELPAEDIARFRDEAKA